MLTIQIEGELEQRLKKAAATAGAEPVVMARHLLEQSLPSSPQVPPDHPNAKTIALLQQWQREDHTDDPEELKRRQAEGDALMEGLARNRFESEGPNARKLWP